MFTFIVCVVKILKVSSLSKFQVHNIDLFTIITMLYVRSPEPSHLIAKSLYPLTNISPFPPYHSPWLPPFYSLLL